MDIPPGTEDKVRARAEAKGVKFVSMPTGAAASLASAKGAAVASPGAAAPSPRRRDPKRPGHFLDEAPAKPALDEVLKPYGLTPRGPTLLDHIANKSNVLPATPPAPARLGPYAKLGDKPVTLNPQTMAQGQQQPRPTPPIIHPSTKSGADAFLSEGALAALEGYITAMVDARISQRAGNSDPKAAERLDAARAEFAGNFVRK